MVREVRADLHELSQPLTVLLCTLEYGMDLTTVAEMRSIMAAAVLECERMKTIVSSLRDKLPLEKGSRGHLEASRSE